MIRSLSLITNNQISALTKLGLVAAIAFALAPGVQAAPTCDLLDAKCHHNMGGLAEAEGDYTQAEEAYRKAAELGFAESQNALGILYISNKVKAASPERAVFWYKLAAQGGNKAAMRNLAAMYRDGVGVTADSAKADEYLQMAAKAGDTTSLTALINEYAQLDQTDRQVRQTLFDLTQAGAEAGDAALQNQLGLYYLRGFWADINTGEAHKWFKAAHDNGNIDGTLNLAETYLNAWGVKRDWGEAMALFKQAYAAGNAQGAYEVHSMYARGMGTRPREDLAREWLVNAVKANHPQATMDLGLALMRQTEQIDKYPLGYALLKRGAKLAGADWDELSLNAKQLLQSDEIAQGEKLYQSFATQTLTEKELSPALLD